MQQRELKNTVPIAQRSETMGKMGSVRNIRRLPRADRAFLLAKINSELGNPLRSETAARIAIKELADKDDSYRVAKRARALGRMEEAAEAAKKAAEYSMKYEEYPRAIKIASEFGMHECARESALRYAKNLLMEGKDSDAEGLLREFGIGGGLPSLRDSIIQDYESNDDHLKLAIFAKRFSLQEKMREAGIKALEKGFFTSPRTAMELAKDFGVTDEEATALLEKKSREMLKEGKYGRIIWAAEYFPIPEDVLKEARRGDVKEAAEKQDPIDALDKAKKYGLPPEEVKGIANEAIKFALSKGDPEDAKSISRDFCIPEKELSDIALGQVEQLIGKGGFTSAVRIGRAIPIRADQIRLLQSVFEIFPDANDS